MSWWLENHGADILQERVIDSERNQTRKMFLPSSFDYPKAKKMKKKVLTKVYSDRVRTKPKCKCFSHTNHQAKISL